MTAEQAQFKPEVPVRELYEQLGDRHLRCLTLADGAHLMGIQYTGDRQQCSIRLSTSGGPQLHSNLRKLDKSSDSEPLPYPPGLGLREAVEAFYGKSPDWYCQDLVLTDAAGQQVGTLKGTGLLQQLIDYVNTHMSELNDQQAQQQAELSRLNDYLGQTQRALLLARLQAGSGIKTKRRFIDNMGHEIRTPLNGIFGMIDLLFDTGLDEEQQQYAKSARNSAEMLLRMIDDILDLSDIEAGTCDIHFEPFDLYQAVDNSVELYREWAEFKGFALLIERECEHRWVVGNANRYERILSNLLSNAVKFTDRGHVAVKVSELLLDGHPYIRTEVIDTGAGLPQHKQRRLFTRFEEAEELLPHGQGITSLGLSVCHRLCELMGGTIDCLSEVGVGSDFYFDLPFSPYDTENISLDTPGGNHTGGNTSQPGDKDFFAVSTLSLEEERGKSIR